MMGVDEQENLREWLRKRPHSLTEVLMCYCEGMDVAPEPLIYISV